MSAENYRDRLKEVLSKTGKLTETDIDLCFEYANQSKQEEVDLFQKPVIHNVFEKPQPQEKTEEPSDIYDEKLIDLLWQVKEGKVHPNRAWKALLKAQENTFQNNELRKAAEKGLGYLRAIIGSVPLPKDQGLELPSVIEELENQLNLNQKDNEMKCGFCVNRKTEE